jgi:DNA-binding CsgD family transcriptional regulator
MTDVGRIRELAACDMHAPAIARELGIDPRLVAYHARRAGFGIFKARRNVTKRERERMEFLARNGKSRAEIAADLGRDKATVKRNLRRKRPQYPSYPQAFPRDAQTVNAV